MFLTLELASLGVFFLLCTFSSSSTPRICGMNVKACDNAQVVFLERRNCKPNKWQSSGSFVSRSLWKYLLWINEATSYKVKPELTSLENALHPWDIGFKEVIPHHRIAHRIHERLTKYKLIRNRLLVRNALIWSIWIIRNFLLIIRYVRNRLCTLACIIKRVNRIQCVRELDEISVRILNQFGTTNEM